MRIRPSMVAAVAASAVVLTACGGSSSGTSTPAPTSASVPSSPPATSADSESPSSAPAAGTSSDGTAAAKTDQGASVPVNKSFTDPVLGEKGTVLKYKRNYQLSAAAKQRYSALVDDEVILVEVRVTASSKYYDQLDSDSFSLTGTADGTDDPSTSILDDEVSGAGYPVLKPADTGKTETGWLVFTPERGLKKLILRFMRIAATTSGGESIPAKNFDIPLAG